ncbi:MAG: GWxTD domain-containing protein, partial [Acidobacteriota bacterium]
SRFTRRLAKPGDTDPLAVARGTVNCALFGRLENFDQVLLRSFVILLGLFLGATAFGATDYKKWLNQEVLWIVSKTEREEFQALKSDAERDIFLEKFWRRRDPTPSTERNEYKEEHYRRLIYASRMFQEGLPGWKTDRGRVYILNGPPDSESFHNSLSTISLNSAVPHTKRSPNTIVWNYHRNESARYYRGEIRVVFQPTSGFTRQNFALGESKAAQDRADQLTRQFGPAADSNWLEADVRYQLVMAGPPAIVNARGAELPTVGIGELAKYTEDLFRSPGEILEERERESQRRERARSELRRSVSSNINYEIRDFEISHQVFLKPSGDWLVPVRVALPLANLQDEKVDLYAALLDAQGNVFDEFLDSMAVNLEQGRQAGQQRLHYFNTFTAPSGKYILRVVLREVQGKRTGLRETPVQLDPSELPKLKFGSLLMTNRVEVLPQSAGDQDPRAAAATAWASSPVFNGTRLLPHPSAKFRADENLFLYFQLWVPSTSVEVSINANFIQEGQIVKRLAQRAIETLQGAWVDYGLMAPLSGFQPGDYVLQIQALDHTAKTFDIQRASFRIEN